MVEEEGHFNPLQQRLNTLVKIQEIRRKAFNILIDQALKIATTFKNKVKGNPFCLHEIVLYWDP